MKTISVRLTETEDKALAAYAQRCGISKNTAVKRLILGEDFINYVLDYFQLARLEEVTHAVKPAIMQKLWEQNRHRAGDPGEPPRTLAEHPKTGTNT